jgi:hypothetical protein
MSEKRTLIRVIVDNIYCAMCGMSLMEAVCEQHKNLVVVDNSLSEAKKISKSVFCPCCGHETPFLEQVEGSVLKTTQVEIVETDCKEPS